MSAKTKLADSEVIQANAKDCKLAAARQCQHGNRTCQPKHNAARRGATGNQICTKHTLSAITHHIQPQMQSTRVGALDCD
eukprot:6473261-Amphidinium_carterae.3